MSTSTTCLESQGYYLIALYYLLSLVLLPSPVTLSVLSFFCLLAHSPNFFSFRRFHLHMVVMCAVYLLDITQPSLPTPLHSILVYISVFMALSAVFHFINPPENSLPSHSVLPVLLVLSTIYLYESLPSPDIIPSG